MAITMNVRDALSGAAGECYFTINGNRYNFMQVKNIDVTAEKQKVDVPILGRVNKGHKSVGMTISGTATFHYNTSVLRQLLLDYKKTGGDFYFEMQVTNEDTTSSAGRQTIVLKDCNIDSLTLTKLDADSDQTLDETMDFTCEDFEMPESFNILDGMRA
jgi:hypothetical protein